MKQPISLQVSEYTVRGYEHNLSNKVVVFFHGYTGNKTENNRLFYHLSNSLEDEGFSTIRMDWLGHGESDLEFSEMTVPLLSEQGRVVLDYACKNYQTVYLLGFSMGGAFAMQLADERIDKLILMAPAYHMGRNKLGYFQNPKEQFVDLGGMVLSREFAEGLSVFNNLESIKRYRNPILILQGAEDAAVSKESSEWLHQNLPTSTLRVFDQANHCFQSREQHHELAQEIITFLQNE